jgi:hypothetical protein
LFPKKKKLEKVNLIIDSSDFQLSGKASTSQKDSKWSYKLNRPRQQFQVICDVRGKVQKVWDGYNPKIYDEYWVEIMVDDLRTLFSGVYIIADTYYELGNKLIKRFGHEKEVVFYISIIKLCGRKKKTSKELLVNISFQLFGLSKE